ncbi:MAG: type I methionyl aminopeptidase [Patescibacteria group bacterium]
MSLIKTPQEIESLKEGGAILSQALVKAMLACKVGATTIDIERAARDFLKQNGAKPSFLGYQTDSSDPPYPSALCISFNDEVVHGPATPERTVREGDLVSLDIGAWYKGLATDMATTILVGKVSPKVRALAEDTRQALKLALGTVRAGAWISDIGASIEDYLKPRGYGIVKDLVGHGVGHAVHEDPQIPNYREPRTPKVRMQSGMILAIEPMVSLGDWRVDQKDDGWTIVTRDHSPAAHFEVTVAVTDKGHELITPWPEI